MGLHPSEIISGYAKAGAKVQGIIDGTSCFLLLHQHLSNFSWLKKIELTCFKCEDPRNVDEVARAIKSAIASKQFGYEDLLSKVIAKACVQILPKNPKNFNVDNVRVTKILGGGVVDTHVIKGFVLARDASGTVENGQKTKFSSNTRIDLSCWL